MTEFDKVSSSVQEFTADDALVFEFVREFASMERVLKVNGFVRGDEKHAKPDWTSLANDLHDSGALDRERLNAHESVRYCLEAPPKRQVVIDGQLRWEPLGPSDGEHETRWVIRVLCTLRNNLFHGGKFADGYVTDPARNPKLLTGGLLLLREIREAEGWNGK